MSNKIERDAHTGVETTGHEWDGIRELNTPLPKWWLYILLASVVVAIIMMVLYPSVPLGRTHTEGLLGYTQRGALEQDLSAIRAQHADVMAQIGTLPIDDVRNSPQLEAMALVAGKAAFSNNCAPCHGPAGQGRLGYPNLADDTWLWGGKLDDLQRTISFGIRSNHPDTRSSEMPRFGDDQILTSAQIGQVADYVMTLYGTPISGADPAPGAKLFSVNCVSCHGEKGEGNREFGAPPLVSQTHLYGATRDVVLHQIMAPRQGVMPAWAPRLDPATIKSLALYVHSLGGGE